MSEESYKLEEQPVDRKDATTLRSLKQGPLASILGHLDLRRQGVLLVLILLAILFHFTTNGIFLSPRNLSQLLRQASILGVAACGMTALIVLGEIDLSVGSVMYLLGVIAAQLNVLRNWGTIPTLAATLVIAVAIGMWNGMCFARMKVPAFVATLAGLMAFRGLGLVMSDAATIFPTSDSYQAISEGFLSPPFSYILIGLIYALYLVLTIRAYLFARRSGSETDAAWLVGQSILVGAAAGVFAWVTGRFSGIPNAVLVLMAVAAAFAFIMTSTVLGRNIYAIGSSREAAALSGISVPRHIFIVFGLLMGVVYFVSSTLMTARLSGSIAGLGQGFELDVIAAVVIGGTSLMGGVGTIPGTLFGALLLATVDNGMSLMNVSSFLQMVIKAALLLLAVWFDVVTRAQQD